MVPVDVHLLAPHTSFHGGDLDCGNGLLLLIREHIDPLDSGQHLLVQSTEVSVEHDLPAWCRLTGNRLVSWTKQGRNLTFLIEKGGSGGRPFASARPVLVEPGQPAATTMATTVPAQEVAPLSTCIVGSWPRPNWMNRAIEDFLRGRSSEQEWREAALDGTRLAVLAQVKAGLDVIADGEQGRDSYASFVGHRLDGCRLIPLTDLLPLVDDPEEFERELRALDVPAAEVRHPVAFGRIRRVKPLVAAEAEATLVATTKPVKGALPGPYLLTRTLWLECFRERAYSSREELSVDVLRVLREETQELLTLGVSIVQFDEPVLSEVVFAPPTGKRSFMCGALGEKSDSQVELRFAERLLADLTAGFPQERLGLHVCRGNWTKDESVLLSGDYRPLLPLLKGLAVGTLFLELSTPRAGEIEVLAELPESMRVGVGLLNPRQSAAESEDEVWSRARRAVDVLGKDRVLFNPDCGFATFAANPVATLMEAERKCALLARVPARLRGA